MTTLVDSGHVYLNDVRFELLGRVSPIMLSGPPPTLEIGEGQQVKEPGLSVITFEDSALGLGVYKLTNPAQIRNSWTSELRNFAGFRCLPEEVVEMTPPSGLTGPILEATFDFGTDLYGIWTSDAGAHEVRKWTESTASWGTSIKDLAAAPTDVLVFYYSSAEYVYVATSGTIWKAADPSLTASWTDLVLAGKWLAEWDGKLFRCTAANLVFVSTDNGVTWTTAKGAIPVPNTHMNGFRKYYDTTGQTQLYALTRRGLFILDFATPTWNQTRLVTPAHSDAGAAGEEWRNDFYFAAGHDILRYIIADTATVTNTGPSRYDGLGAEFGGAITKMIGTYNELFVLLKPTVSSAAYYAEGSFWGVQSLWPGPALRTNPAYCTLLAWDGAGWRVVWSLGATATTAVVWMARSQANSKHRLLWSTNYASYYMDLPLTLRNPRVLAAPRFRTGSYIYEITPWINGGIMGRNKLAVRAFVSKRNMPNSQIGDRGISLEYGLDLQDDVWQPIIAKDKTIEGSGWKLFMQDGMHEGMFTSDSLGQPFEFLRMRLGIYSENADQSPYVDYFGFYFAVIPRQRWGYNFTIKLAEGYGNKPTAKLQRDHLLSLLPTTSVIPKLVKTQFNDVSLANNEVMYTLLTRVVSTSGTGDDYSGQWNISLIPVLP